jgi:hypothetical protein
LSVGSIGTARWRIFISSTFLICASFFGSDVLGLEDMDDGLGDAADVVFEEGKCCASNARATSFLGGAVD